MMIVIGLLHFNRVGSDSSKEDRALAPMIAFELLLNYFKVRIYHLLTSRTHTVHASGSTSLCVHAFQGAFFHLMRNQKKQTLNVW